MKYVKRIIPILIFIGIAVKVYFSYNFLYLEEIGSIGDRPLYCVTINGRTFQRYGGVQNSGGLNSATFQRNKKPIGRIDNRPVYELGENTAYLVRNTDDRMRPCIYYDAEIYPDGLPKNGEITGFVVQYSADFELDEYYNDEKVVAYLNAIYTTSPDLLVIDEKKWKESEGDPSIILSFCFENAPVSLVEMRCAYIRKTDQGILICVWDEERDENYELIDYIERKAILDKEEGKMFDPYFEIKKKYMDK